MPSPLVTAHEIRPRQLRALILLLVLVPLIPTGLMLRFMIDARAGERAAALEESSVAYRQILRRAESSLARHLASAPSNRSPEAIHEFYRGLLDPEVAIEITDESGQTRAGQSEPGREPIARSSLAALGLPWVVQISLANPTPATEHFSYSTWAIGLVLMTMFGIATAAGLTLSRQMELRDLKSTAVATVAHELRTPLASIRMLVDTLREGRCTSEQQRHDYLDLIAQETLRLSRLTQNFLTHARLERNQHPMLLSSAAPEPIVLRAIQLLGSKLEQPAARFRLELEPGLPKIAADEDALVTVLSNLLENALKYGGTGEIGLAVRNDGNSVRFTVSDQGLGIDAAELKHVFEPFYQADQKLSRTREGCGLGLSIVRQIVDEHGGSITVESAPGVGSSFIVRIPHAATRI